MRTIIKVHGSTAIFNPDTQEWVCANAQIAQMLNRRTRAEARGLDYIPNYGIWVAERLAMEGKVEIVMLAEPEQVKEGVLY